MPRARGTRLAAPYWWYDGPDRRPGAFRVLRTGGWLGNFGNAPGSSNVDPSDQVLRVVSVAPPAIERPERARPRAALIETVSASRRYGFSTNSKTFSPTGRASRLYPVARRTGSSGLRSRRVRARSKPLIPPAMTMSDSTNSIAGSRSRMANAP